MLSPDQSIHNTGSNFYLKLFGTTTVFFRLTDNATSRSEVSQSGNQPSSAPTKGRLWLTVDGSPPTICCRLPKPTRGRFQNCTFSRDALRPNQSRLRNNLRIRRKTRYSLSFSLSLRIISSKQCRVLKVM